MPTLRTLGRLELLDGKHPLRLPRIGEAAVLSAEVRLDYALHPLSQAVYRLTRGAAGPKLETDRFRVVTARPTVTVHVRQRQC